MCVGGQRRRCASLQHLAGFFNRRQGPRRPGVAWGTAPGQRPDSATP
nr:hypothetical protein RVX_1344 [Nitratidesulfovibrio sp. HK-II]